MILKHYQGYFISGLLALSYATNPSMDLSKLTPSQGLRIEGRRLYDEIGISVSPVGDVNADGWSDVMIGAPNAAVGWLNGAGISYIIFGNHLRDGVIDLAELTISQGLRIEGPDAGMRCGHAVSGVGDINGDKIDDILIGSPDASPQDRKNAGISYLIWGGTNLTNKGVINLSNFDASQGVQILGATQGESSGYSVSYAGDINGDQQADILIGAPFASIQGRNVTGITYVLWGGEHLNEKGTIDLSTLGSSQGLRIEGATLGGQNGRSVASGDVNRDGQNDLLIGANGLYYYSPEMQSASYVLWGGKELANSEVIYLSRLTKDQGLKIDGAQYGGGITNYNIRLCVAGDINDDGYKDILISSPGRRHEKGNNVGTTYLLWGGEKINSGGVIDLTTLTPEQGLRIERLQFSIVGTSSGISLDAAGDVNGDGIDDILIGNNVQSTDVGSYAGAVYVIWGKPGLKNTEAIDLDALTLAQGVKIEGVTGWLGTALAGIGDINGDGRDDIMIAAIDASPQGRESAGIVYVLWNLPVPNILDDPWVWVGIIGGTVACLLTTVGAIIGYRRYCKSNDSYYDFASRKLLKEKIESTSLKDLAEQKPFYQSTDKSFFEKIPEKIPEQKEQTLQISQTSKLPDDGLHMLFQIKFGDLVFDKILGEGGFGKVFQGTWHHNNVAIKQLKINNLSANSEQEFHREAEILAQLRHPNIVRFYGVSIDRKPYCIVMEYLPTGSLKDLLRSKISLDWTSRQKIALDIANGILYLHHYNPPILHRDLKSLNILIDHDFKAKLCDFGLAQIKREINSTITTGNGAVGTLAWMAPELFERHSKYTDKADIYSYGVILWEISTRELPFKNINNVETIQNRIEKGHREEIPSQTPPSMAQLVSKCWSLRPEERPSIKEAVQSLQPNKNILVTKTTPTASSMSGYSDYRQTRPNNYRT